MRLCRPQPCALNQQPCLGRFSRAPDIQILRYSLLLAQFGPRRLRCSHRVNIQILTFNRLCSFNLFLDRLALYVGADPGAITELIFKVGIGAFTSFPPRIEAIAAEIGQADINYFTWGIRVGDLASTILDQRTPSP